MMIAGDVRQLCKKQAYLYVRYRCFSFLVFFALLLFSRMAWAHQVSIAYLELHKVDQQQVDIVWEIAVEDLQFLYNLDSDRDGKVQWGEVIGREYELKQLVGEKLSFTKDGKVCSAGPSLDILVHKRVTGAYLRFGWRISCDNGVDQADLEYKLYSGLNHLIFCSAYSNSEMNRVVLKPGMSKVDFLASAHTSFSVFKNYFASGVEHIIEGYDHLAFLLTLLIATLAKFPNSMNKVLLRRATKDILLVVTAFTLSHSITLALASLRLVSFESWIIEASIAFSILVSALLTLANRHAVSRPLLAFGFGLLHGFGFATILLEDQPTHSDLFLALGGFNIGVEAGQLIVVCCAVPLLVLCKTLRIFDYVVVKGTSLALAALASYWMVERLGIL